MDIDVGCVLAGGGKLGKGDSFCVHGSSLSVDVRKDGLENGENLIPIVVIDNHLLYNASIAQRNSKY
nr:MAG TPA: Lumazine binding domain [Caudoviricetes sp.]